MASEETALAQGMVSLMLHFSWIWVGVAITEGPKGLRFLADVTKEMDRNRVCMAFVKMIPVDPVSYMTHTEQHELLVGESSAVNVVIIYYDADSLNDINYSIGLHLVTWRVWVTNSQWHADLTGKKFLLDSFHGTIIFSNHHEEISGFKHFVQTVNLSMYPEDIFLYQFWYWNFNCLISESDCSLKNCTPNASLAQLPANRFDPAMSDVSYNIYNAVYTVAHALHEMTLQQVQMQNTGSGERRTFSPWQVICLPLDGEHCYLSPFLSTLIVFQIF